MTGEGLFLVLPALPLQPKVRKEDATTDDSEKTEVIHGAENIINITIQNFPVSKERIDNCIDSTAQASLVKTEPVWKSLIEVKQRGVKLRYIIEITKENISYCN